MAENKKSHKTAAIVVVVIIVLIVVGITWAFFARWGDSQDALSKGCVPLTADKYGIPTTYRCPPGVYLH